jgi:hypothetical protein
MVLEGEKTKAQAIATISRSEHRARCFRKFHLFTKPPRTHGGLAYVIQTNEAGAERRIQHPCELETTLLHRNRLHFAQAQGTPFTTPPLCNSLTFSGVSPLGASILNGDRLPPDIQPNVRAILTERKQVRPTLSHTISFQAMIAGFTKWRESTTTSPSNKHLGIYKSLIRYHQHTSQQQDKPTLEDDTLAPTALLALQIQHQPINLAIKHTHTLERWKIVHNFFL